MYHLITGGSSGLGYEIAKLLILMDEHVIILGRNVQKLESARLKLQEISQKADVLAYSLDISEEKDIEGFIETLESSGRRIKHLYNVAGTTFYGSALEVTKESIDEVLRANLIGLMLFTSKMLSYMLKDREEGKRIISVLSTAALVGKRYETLYNAAKWGAKGYLESLRAELQDVPIEVINVYPGGMKTPFWNDTASDYDIEQFMDPADVARNIVRASMDKKVYTTDITINRPKSI